MSETTAKRFPAGWLIFSALMVLGAVGLFNFTRDFTTCWRLTALPGIAPASCTGSQVKAFEEPVFSTPQATATPTATPEPPIPEVEYPTWDGGSRINILFVGLRGGHPLEQDCPF